MTQQEYYELERELPRKSQGWYGILRYNYQKIDQTTACLEEFYIITLWWKELERKGTQPDPAEKAKAVKFLNEWVNLFDERPVAGENNLPINQRLNIVMTRAMAQVKKDITFCLLSPPKDTKEDHVEEGWSNSGYDLQVIVGCLQTVG